MRVMSQSITRREALKRITSASAGVALSGGMIRGQAADITIGGRPVEIAVSSLSPVTVRISVLPIAGGAASGVPRRWRRSPSRTRPAVSVPDGRRIPSSLCAPGT